ncbi:glycosyltransferase 87 family protein [Streptomyces sp. NPDC088554]|uniref:glycosyltransferase 87 family protein n=1 Tax=Streptomyces sp. NPDC088554 TaxID=3365865 RepID=UPI003828CCD0
MAGALVLRAEGAAVVGGTDLYGFTVTEWQLPPTYPPFAAILFVPSTWLPVGALKAVLIVGNAVLLVLLVRLSWRFAALPAPALPAPALPAPALPAPALPAPALPAPALPAPALPAPALPAPALPAPGWPAPGWPAPALPAPGWPAPVPAPPVPLLAVLTAVAVGLWLEPVFQTVLFGQISLAVVCLVLWDLSRPEHALGKGFALGVAAGITLTPAVLIGYLLLTGRLRSGVTALASLTATVLLGTLVLPQASGEFWTDRVPGAFGGFGTAGAWTVENQSLYGMFARLLHTPDPGALWVVAAGLTAVGGLWTARRVAVRAGSEPWGVLAAALTALLVSPLGWSHHWVWCVPLLAVLIAEGRFRTAMAVGVVWTARSFWVVPHEGDLDLALPWWQQPLASPYTLSALGLLVFAAWRGNRTAPARPVVTIPSQPSELPQHPERPRRSPRSPGPAQPSASPASSSSASTIR